MVFKFYNMLETNTFYANTDEPNQILFFPEQRMNVVFFLKCLS